MSDESEYGEYPGGYTTDYPPHWVRPLLEQYPPLTMRSCGYQKGSWAELAFETEDGPMTVKLRREVTNDITVKGLKSGQIRTSVTEKNVKERDEQIGAVLDQRLSGYASFAEALDAEL